MTVADNHLRMIYEENVFLLETRCHAMDFKKGEWLFRHEVEYKDFLQSLTTEEVMRIVEVDYPLFELNLLPSNITRVGTHNIEMFALDVEQKLIYETNLQILANRWSLSQGGELDEIRFNTKVPIFEALKNSTFRQVQDLAVQPGFVSKFCISLATLQKLALDNSLTREARNRIVINN